MHVIVVRKMETDRQRNEGRVTNIRRAGIKRGVGERQRDREADMQAGTERIRKRMTVRERTRTRKLYFTRIVV